MTNRKKKILFGVGAALLVLMMAAAGVYAWYMSLTTNLIDPQTLSVTTSKYLEVRRADVPEGDPSGEFSSALMLSFNELELVDITGNGVTLVRPLLDQDTDPSTGTAVANPDDDPDKAWITPVANRDYIETVLEFRSNKPLEVFLGSGSSITPHCGTEESSLFGDNVERPSNYGSFTRDLIAGAARVSFEPASSVNRTVWEPNREYELYFNEGWGFRLDGTPETPHKYWYIGAGNAKLYAYLEDIQTVSIVYDADLQNTTTAISYPDADGAKAHVVTLDQYDPSTHEYTATVTLRIWIEGCDREARRALAGGEIDAALYFYGYEHETSGN